MFKLGKDLEIGDRMKVWWSSGLKIPNVDIIINLELPYPPNKKMMQIFKNGYCFAHFVSGTSMTIDFADTYEIAEK